MALILAVTIFFSDSMLVEASQSIFSLMSTETHNTNDSDVWSFEEAFGSSLPIKLKEDYYNVLRELVPRIKGNGDGTVTIKWNPVSGAKQYKFTLIDDSNNKYEKVCSLIISNATSCTFSLKNPSTGPYWLWLSAEDNQGNIIKNIKAMKVQFPSDINRFSSLPEPSNISASINGTTATISFKGLQSAKNYTVLFDGKEYAVNRLANATRIHELVIRNIDPTAKHSYAIRSNLPSKIGIYNAIMPEFNYYNAVPGEYGETRYVSKDYVEVGAVKINSKTATENSVTVSWNAAKDASSYEVNVDGDKYITTDTTKTVTGLNAGKTYKVYVVAKNEYTSSISQTVDIKTPPKAPQTVNVVSAETKATLSWNSQEGASGYQISYFQNGKESITTCPSSSNPSITLTGLTPNTEYSYKIRCTSTDGVSEYGPLNYFTTKAEPKIEKAPDVIYASAEGTSFTIRWNMVDGASEYEIVFDNKIYKTSSKSYTFSGLKPGSTYNYKLRGIDGEIKGPYTNEVLIVMPPEAPNNLNYSANGNEITLKWDKVNGATAYVVDFNGNIRECLATTTSTRFTGLKIDTVYPCTIKCKNNYGTGESKSFGTVRTTKEVKNVEIPNVLSPFVTENSVKVSWKEALNANQYEIIFDGKAYKTSGLSYTFTGLKPNSEHTYKVQGLYGKIESGFSYERSIKTMETTPNITATAYRNAIKLEWEKREDVTYIIKFDNVEYKVYRDTEKTFENLANNSTHTYSISIASTYGQSSYSPTRTISTSNSKPCYPSPRIASKASYGDGIDISWTIPKGATAFDIEVDGKVTRVQSSAYHVVQGKDSKAYFRVRAVGDLGVGEYSKTETLKFPPKGPDNVEFSSTATTITAKWKPVNGAEGYYVKVGNEEHYLDKNETSYTFTGLKPDYSYECRVLCTADDLFNYAYYHQTKKTVRTEKLGVPTGINGEGKTTSITFRWDAVEGATGYQIKVNGKQYSSPYTGYTLSQLEPETAYSISVAAYLNGVTGQYSNPITIYTNKLSEPDNVRAASIYSDEAIITWNGNSDATEVEVWVDGKTYLVKNNSSFNLGVLYGEPITYKVRFKRGDKYSNYSELKTLVLPPETVTGIKAVVKDYSIDVTWNPSKGAERYEVTASAVGGGMLKGKVVDSCNASFEVRGGYDYNISVYPFNSNKRNTKGTPVKVWIKPEAPQLYYQKVTNNSAIFKWYKTDGAEEYEVVFDGKKYETTGTSIEFKNLKPNSKYSFKICAIRNKTKGRYTEEVEITTYPDLPATPTNIKASALSSSVYLKWDSADNAEEYLVSFNKQKFRTNTPYITIEGLKPNTAYDYYVQSLNKTGGSNFSSTQSIKTLLAPPDIKKCDFNGDRLDIHIAPVKDAESYVFSLEGSEYETDKLSISIGNLEPEKFYKLKVYAKNKEVDGEASTEEISTKMLAPKVPNGIKATSTRDSVALLWPSVDGAESYDIYFEGETYHVDLAAEKDVVNTSSVVKEDRKVSTFSKIKDALSSLLSGSEKLLEKDNESTNSFVFSDLIEYKSYEITQSFTGLVPETMYEFYIRANGKYGSSAYSLPVKIETLDASVNVYNSDYEYSPSDKPEAYFDGHNRYTSADPVDSVTGAFMWTDAIVEDFGADDLHFDVFYRSNVYVENINTVRDMGPKWSHTFDYALKLEGGKAYFTTPYDTTLTFVKNGKEYVNASVNDSSAFKEVDGDYVVTTSDNTDFVFNKNRRLCEIKKDGKVVYLLSFNDDTNTLRISSKRSAYIDVKYISYRIAEVEDSLGNEVKFKYKDHYLDKITNRENAEVSFEYDSNGNITEITGFDGKVYLKNEYDEKGRVVKQKLADRGETTAIYNDEDRVNIFTDEKGVDTSYKYDMSGRIVSVVSDARTFTNEYDENGRLYKQTDSEGNVTVTEYDKKGRVCKITYPDDSFEESEYNDEGKPVWVRSRDGFKVSYEYDKNGNLLRYTDKRGNVSTYNYDISGNLLKYTDNLGNEWRYEYDNFSHLTKSIDPEGNTSKFTYDRAGRLTSVIAPNGSKTYYEYSPAGHLLSERDGEGKIEYSYDVNGNLTKIKDKQGNEKTFAYDEMGNLLMEKDEEGNAYYYSYDEAGNLIKTFCPDDSIEEIEYDSYGFVSATKDKNGNLTSFEYDKNGNVIKETDALGSAFEYEYDSMGQLILSKDPLGHETRYSYDAMGRIISITDPLGFIVSYTYDENGNVLSKTDEEGNTTFFEYDAENQLIKTTDATGSSYVNYDKAGNVTSVIDKEENEESYSYDKEGNVISSLDKNGNRWTYNYDIYGRLISEMAPNFALTKYEYDKNGNCVSMTDALERTITYEHNAVGQLTKKTDSLGNETSYKYDAMGRVREVTDANGNVTKLRYDANSNLIESENPVGGIQTYTYDELNRCIGGTDEEGNSWSYTYDALGNKTSYTDPNGNVVRFAYDADNRLTTVTDQNGETLNYSYTKTGSVSKLIDEEGAETSYEYDALGRVVKILDALGNSTTFTYDKNGNVLTRTDANQNTYSFEYSPLGELIKEIDPLGNETKYKYDAIGSLISKTDANGNETKYEYDALGQPIKVTDSRGAETKFSYTPDGHISKVEDALGNINTYSYDACGNLLKTTDALGNAIRYEYDALNNCIKEYSDENGNEESVTLYEYDKKGRCIKEITPLSYVKEYKYDGNGNVISSTDEEGREIKVSYDLNNNPLTKTYNDGTTVSYRYNKRGELVEVTDWTGVTSFERNILGQVTKVTEFDGKSVGYDYDGVGNVVKIEYPDGKVVSYGYDKNDRISTIKDGESVLSEYAYDAVGNVVSIKGPNSEQIYEYSKTNLPTKLKTYVNGYEEEIESYTYDLLGRMTVLEREGKSGRDSISYHYDAAGELTKAVYDNKTEENLYDARGNRIQKLVNGELFESYTYNTGNELISKSDSLHNYTYEYDKCGNLVKESTDGETSIEYTYNLDGKMTLGKNLVTGEETAYTYNALGMMVSHAAVYNEDILPILENAIPETVPEIVDPNEEIEENIPGAIIPDTDVSGNDETLNTPETPDNVTVPDVSYNDTGAPVTTSFTEGILSVDVPGVSGNEIEDLDVLPDVNITDESNDILSLEDDSNLENEIVIEEPTAELLEKEPREITERVVNDYLSDSRNVLYKESTADGAVRYVYGNAFEQIAIGREESYTAVLSDIYLTPFAFVDNNDGEYTNIGHVDAWGNSFDDDESERYFTSYEFDSVIGKYFAKARFYDPTTGRMISPDPVKRSLNPYYYCENDPANKVDSDGEIAEWLVAGAVNGVVRGALGIAESYISQIGNGKSFAEKTKNALAHGANEGIKGFASGATAVIAGTPIAAAVNFVAGAAGDALEQYITTGSVDVKQSVKAGATNTVRELIYRGGKCPLSDFGTAIGKGALSKGAEAAIDYAVDAAAYSINKAKKKNSTTATDTQTQPITYDSKYSLSNGSKKTSSFEVSYGSQQVRGYNEEEKNPYSLAGFLKHTAKGALEGAAENAVFYGVEKVFGAAKNVLSCFVAGTLIKTSEGLIPIEEIRVGDEVFAYNIETGETELKEVKQLFVHEENELVHLVINGEKIDTTKNHPFFVENLGFISAKDLQAGDELSLYDGSTASVESMEIEVLDEPVLVYNFEVEDFHTYFVGRYEVLVHNTCEGETQSGLGSQADIKTGVGYGASDNPVRVEGEWTINDMKQGLLGHAPRSLGTPDIHHGDQMPGGALHEILADQHRNNSVLHPNLYNQGVTNEMRTSDRMLHWWYRAREQGADELLPNWIYDN